uniref:(northern house mosquito) hypothetical protein n=1 Tax=Culex pipiens TaxID=7175 RepID=A0A8D8FDR2_CULPI
MHQNTKNNKSSATSWKWKNKHQVLQNCVKKLSSVCPHKPPDTTLVFSVQLSELRPHSLSLSFTPVVCCCRLLDQSLRRSSRKTSKTVSKRALLSRSLSRIADFRFISDSRFACTKKYTLFWLVN